VTKGEELLAEFRRQRRAGDPRLSEEGKAILLRITMGDLGDEFADSPAAISEADPLLRGGPDDADDESPTLVVIVVDEYLAIRSSPASSPPICRTSR